MRLGYWIIAIFGYNHLIQYSIDSETQQCWALRLKDELGQVQICSTKKGLNYLELLEPRVETDGSRWFRRFQTILRAMGIQ